MSTKPNIVLVHGFWGGAAHWAKVIVELKRRGYDPTGVWATREAMRAGERRLAEQAEASYKRMVSDWQAATPKKAGASVTPGRASQKPPRGKVARQTTSP